MVDLVQTQFSRMFVLENRAGPTTAPAYQGLWKAGAFTWTQGDVTLVRIGDPDQYGSFLTIDKISGDKGAPSLTITSRYDFQISDLLRIVRRGCDSDYQIHFGKCKNPRDFDRGWEKILVIESARPTNYSTGDLGAADPSERAIVTEEVPIAGEDAYELKPIIFSQKAAAQIARQLVGVVVCDTATCGICGLPSDGCEIIFGVTRSSAASSPGLVAEIIASIDGGNTWYDVDITSLGITENPIGMRCVAENLVVISLESESLHYASISELVNEDVTPTWTEITEGFVAAKGPRAISTASPTFTWIVGSGGYIYFTQDPTSGVEVQDAGSVTVQNYQDVHALDNERVLVVGAANTVAYTLDGGAIWLGVIGPAPGVILNAAWMVDDRTWWVGTDGGRLYYTTDYGAHWHEKGFPGSGGGVIRDIVFYNKTVGYMAHSVTSPALAGRILRTINGGFTWYIAPEDTGQRIPANDFIAKLAVCADPNKVFGVGVADDNVGGIMVVGA